jgi:2-methylisocitrate lyase-like PEP mutase family enzyme
VWAVEGEGCGGSAGVSEADPECGRGEDNPDFVIIARTDARNAKSFGGDKAEAEAVWGGLKRLKEAMAAGADVAFMESPRTKEEMSELVRELAPHPVMINVLPDVGVPTRPVTTC